MFSSWATGKTLSLIVRAVTYSELIPNNLGIIFRKEYTDLRDSTVKDFERYTGLKVDSTRSVKYANGSEILFRHLEELNNIQNVNLGWFAFEQADEIETDKEFFTLFGRLRRNLKPTETFTRLGLPVHSGFVIANAGDHWGKRLWKQGELDDSECIEATTLDNKANLPQSFLDSLEILRKSKPELYRQYVENDWTVNTDQFILIKPSIVDALKGLRIHLAETKELIAFDPSMGGDEFAIYVFRNSEIIDSLFLHEKDSMKAVGHLSILSTKHKIDDFAGDSIGIGGPICDRLQEIGKRVVRVNVAKDARNTTRYGNLKSEIWDYVANEMMNCRVMYPNDPELIKQLTTTKYRVINSNGKFLMEHKNDTRKRLDRSPDRADAYVLGLWALQHIQPKSRTKKDAYSTVNEDYGYNPMTV